MQETFKKVLYLTAVLASSLASQDAFCAWLIGAEVEDGVEQAPHNQSSGSPHQSGRPYLPLYSREWLDLDPDLRQHVLKAWREISNAGLTPFFNDGVRSTQDTIELAAACKQSVSCAHPPTIGPSSRHVRGSALDMQAANYRGDWKVFFTYFQILDDNDLYIPLGGSDLPHVEKQASSTGDSRLAFVDLFNSIEGNPAGTMKPWSREYMVRSTARSHWEASQSETLKRKLLQSRVNAIKQAERERRAKIDAARATARSSLSYGTTSFPTVTVGTTSSPTVSESQGLIYLPAACVDDNCVPEEYLTPTELKERIENEATDNNDPG